MKLDAKTIGIILTFLTSCGGGITWIYNEAREKGKLEAEVQLKEKYEDILYDNITLRATCCK